MEEHSNRATLDQSYLSKDGGNEQTSLATPTARASKNPKVIPNVQLSQIISRSSEKKCFMILRENVFGCVDKGSIHIKVKVETMLVTEISARQRIMCQSHGETKR